MNGHVEAYSDKYYEEMAREHAYLLQYVVLAMLDGLHQSQAVRHKASAFAESLCEDIGTDDIIISIPVNE